MPSSVTRVSFRILAFYRSLQLVGRFTGLSLTVGVCPALPAAIILFVFNNNTLDPGCFTGCQLRNLLLFTLFLPVKVTTVTGRFDCNI